MINYEIIIVTDRSNNTDPWLSQEALKNIGHNARATKIKLFEDKNLTQSLDLSSLYEIVSKGYKLHTPPLLYAEAPYIPYEKTKKVFFIIRIAFSSLIIYPMAPYCFKKKYNETNETLDLNVYAKLGLELVNGFKIFGIETKINNNEFSYE
jgi:hypothetical protein